MERAPAKSAWIGAALTRARTIWGNTASNARANVHLQIETQNVSGGGRVVQENEPGNRCGQSCSNPLISGRSPERADAPVLPSSSEAACTWSARALARMHSFAYGYDLTHSCS